MRQLLGTSGVVVAVCAAVCGCADEPTAPSGYAKPQPPPPLQVQCATTPTLRCSASLYGEGDVTAAASWSAADSRALAQDVPVTPSDAIVFAAPGLPIATRACNVYIRADYISRGWYQNRAASPHAYALAPGSAAVPLGYVQGTVTSGGKEIGDATVTIVAGEGVGTSDVTRANGYFTIDFLHLAQPFTIRASKPGYSTDTREHTGVALNEFGVPSNGMLVFTIDPVR